MRFVLRMLGRELRASWLRLVFFFVCVAVGVGAIVALRSIIQDVRTGLTREARTLTAADLLIQTSRPWTPEVTASIATTLAASRATADAQLVETTTLVRPADDAKAVARMVELQAVSNGWPLAGRVELDGGAVFSHALLQGRGVLVRPEVLTQLGVKVGDGLKIGDASFVVRGVVLSEPGRRLGFFSVGPRVLIDHADLPATGLLRLGSRARYVRLANLPAAALDTTAASLREQFKNAFVTVRTYRTADDQLGDDLQRAEDYLSLVGFVIVVLGGIGVWSVTRVFVQQKTRAIAILKCVGATTGQVLAVYVAQVALLGLVGCLAGVAVAWAGLQAIPQAALEGLGGSQPSITWSASLQGIGVGLLVSLLFSLVPLLDVRRVKPLALLRDQAADAAASGRQPLSARVRQWWRGIDAVQIGSSVGLVAGLVAVASWQASSLRVGLVVCLAFFSLTMVLQLAGTVLVRAVQPLRRARWFPLRHAVISISRPGNQTRTILLAVGLGAFFILGVQALEMNLLRAFRLDLRSDGPDLFLVDIQPDQEAGVRTLLASAVPSYAPAIVPTLRARVTGVQGARVRLDGLDEVRGQGSLAREYVITYRSRLEPNETVIDGTFATTATAQPEVSIEESIHQRFRIEVGDVVRFDVLGRPIDARVSSVRRVEWSDARTGGFMFVFAPGALERAPQTFIAITRGPADTADRARLQRDIVAAFPNVSAIDVRDVAQRVEAVARNLTLAISIVGGVAVFSGLLILIGSIAMTKFQRLHESAVFKTLGATTATVASTLAAEYATLGALAGALGAIASVGLSWFVCRQILDVPWSPLPWLVGGGVLVAVVLVGGLGVVSSLDVLRRKPLAVLRTQ